MTTATATKRTAKRTAKRATATHHRALLQGLAHDALYFTGAMYIGPHARLTAQSYDLHRMADRILEVSHRELDGPANPAFAIDGDARRNSAPHAYAMSLATARINLLSTCMVYLLELGEEQFCEVFGQSSLDTVVKYAGL